MVLRNLAENDENLGDKENILGKKSSMANVMPTAQTVWSKENLFKQEASKHSSKNLNELVNNMGMMVEK